MSDLHRNNQEAQISPEDQKQLWRMRWFFVVLFAFWAIAILLAIIIVLYVTKAGALPLLIPVISSLGFTLRRPIRYLFPIGKGDLELAKERTRLARQRKDMQEACDETRMHRKITRGEMLCQSTRSLVHMDDSIGDHKRSRQQHD